MDIREIEDENRVKALTEEIKKEFPNIQKQNISSSISVTDLMRCHRFVHMNCHQIA